MSRSGPARESGPIYEDLVTTYANRIWRLAYRLTGDRQEAEDLTQETYFEAWRSLPSLREPEAAGGWLTSILMHRASRRMRRLRTQPPLEGGLEDQSATSPLPGPDLDALARKEQLQRALDSLDPDRRAAFLLVFQEGCSCREAAERLGVPLGTILSRVHRARGELRQQLRRGHGARGILRRNDTGGGA